MPPRKKVNKRTVPLTFNNSINTDKIYCSPTHGVIYPVTLEAVPVEQCSVVTLDQHFDSDLFCNATREIKLKPFLKHSSMNSKYPNLRFTEEKTNSDKYTRFNSISNKDKNVFQRTKSAEVIHLRSDKSILRKHLISESLDKDIQSKKPIFDHSNANACELDIVKINYDTIDKDLLLENLDNKEVRANISIQKRFVSDDSTDSELEPLSPTYNDVNFNNDNNYTNNSQKNLIKNTNYNNETNQLDNDNKSNIQIQMITNNFSKDNINDNVNNNHSIALSDIHNIDGNLNMHETWSKTFYIPTILTPQVTESCAKLQYNKLSDGRNLSEYEIKKINDVTKCMNTNLRSVAYNHEKFVANTPPYQYDWSFRQKQLKNIFIYN